MPADDSRPEWLRCALVAAMANRGYRTELEAALRACTAF
jgi:hypothetical protein